MLDIALGIWDYGLAARKLRACAMVMPQIILEGEDGMDCLSSESAKKHRVNLSAFHSNEAAKVLGKAPSLGWARAESRKMP